MKTLERLHLHSEDSQAHFSFMKKVRETFLPTHEQTNRRCSVTDIPTDGLLLEMTHTVQRSIIFHTVHIKNFYRDKNKRLLVILPSKKISCRSAIFGLKCQVNGHIFQLDLAQVLRCNER